VRFAAIPGIGDVGRIARVIQRVFFATVGAYALAASLVALLAVLLPRTTGMSRGDAAMLSAMLGLPLLLGLMLWASCDQRQARIFVVIVVGAVGSFVLTKMIAV
jgi:hypothetical protein